ncbi:M15 family metallopeptidase [Seohaeicola saemankumensis]|nr:M15 family metallopeptidase [Seohaeicola saemankumensis]MCA0870052.1 M15 family metallopeptidase [Seohaeicola saemankumensis]
MASTDQLRQWWGAYECKKSAMKKIAFFKDKIRIAPGTDAAWKVLETIMAAHGYKVRNGDTGAYNCRNIGGTNLKSLHSYGIALDVNWTTNPYKDHAGTRPVIFSDKPTQKARAKDVKAGLADTDMTPGMIADILAVRTVEGVPVFEWGGTWNGVKDAMHFELDLAPEQLAKGIDMATVNAAPVMAAVQPPVASPPGMMTVTARSGLYLRSGPGTDFAKMQLMPFGTVVQALGTSGDWTKLSLEADGIPDGHAHVSFLAPVSATAAGPVTMAAEQAETITAAGIKPLFHPSAGSNIDKHWPQVRDALKRVDLGDVPMIAMALGTINAETAGFVPISEYISKYNTKVTPFDLYDAGTAKGAKLGNTVPGDGPRFKGRGFVQLTGRYNYSNIGTQLGQDLTGDPELANDPVIASGILARFLKNKESQIRAAIADDDLRLARKLVNGGSHGLDAFTTVFRGVMTRFG